MTNLKNSIISLIKDDSSFILSGGKMIIKGALIGLYLTPSYYVYKTTYGTNLIK